MGFFTLAIGMDELMRRWCCIMSKLLQFFVFKRQKKDIKYTQTTLWLNYNIFIILIGVKYNFNLDM